MAATAVLCSKQQLSSHTRNRALLPAHCHPSEGGYSVASAPPAPPAAPSDPVAAAACVASAAGAGGGGRCFFALWKSQTFTDADAGTCTGRVGELM